METARKKQVIKQCMVGVALLAAAVISSAGQHNSNVTPAPENSCAVCHSDVHVELKDSNHAREGVKCADCHGGNPNALNVAGAHTGNFRGSFDRKQIVELCARCHSDAAKMKPYGIPIDQHALYLTSVHGKKLTEGDKNVAVCTDCHGTHRILGPSDPKSPVFAEKIPETCGRCHENPDLMKAYNVPANVVSEYRLGVHGSALLERHNSQAPECASCHGTHGAAPPGIGDVSKVCGQCHTKTLEAFRQGPHSAAMTKGEHSECASCHSNHRIETASHQLWSTACSSCHASDSREAERGRKIQALFLQTEGEIDKARSAIEAARRIPLDVTDYETRLSDALTYMVEARPASHDLALDSTEDLTRQARSIATEIQTEVDEKMGVFRGRRIVLLLVLFYILITVGVVVKYRRELEAKRGRKPEPPLA